MSTGNLSNIPKLEEIDKILNDIEDSKENSINLLSLKELISLLFKKILLNNIKTIIFYVVSFIVLIKIKNYVQKKYFKKESNA